jgi:hypothetical protein
MSSPMFGENVRLAQNGEFPFVVSIKRRNLFTILQENNHACSGVLVSNKDIITVNHCFQNVRDYITEVIVGSNDLCLGTIHYVSQWLSFNQWSTIRNVETNYITNDIAMIRVSNFSK